MTPFPAQLHSVMTCTGGESVVLLHPAAKLENNVQGTTDDLATTITLGYNHYTPR